MVACEILRFFWRFIAGMWEFNIAVENHHLSWENPLEMAMFNSYVRLPEGKYVDFSADQVITKEYPTNGDQSTCFCVFATENQRI